MQGFLFGVHGMELAGGIGTTPSAKSMAFLYHWKTSRDVSCR